MKEEHYHSERISILQSIRTEAGKSVAHGDSLYSHLRLCPPRWAVMIAQNFYMATTVIVSDGCIHLKAHPLISPPCVQTLALAFAPDLAQLEQSAISRIAKPQSTLAAVIDV